MAKKGGKKSSSSGKKKTGKKSGKKSGSTAVEKSNAGRDPLYTPEKGLEIAKELEDGEARIKDICARHKIGVSTYYDWLDRYPEFSDAVKKAKKLRYAALDELADRGMKKLLEGFEYTEVETKGIRPKKSDGSDGSTIIYERKEKKKFIPPSETMIIFVKTNRDPANWKHRNQIEIDDGREQRRAVPDIENLTDEELRTLEYLQKKALGMELEEIEEADFEYVTDKPETTKDDGDKKEKK